MSIARQKKAESHKLASTLCASILGGDERWVIRKCGPGTQPKIEFLSEPDVRKQFVEYTLTIKPGKGSCYLRWACCETVELRIQDAVTWLHCSDRKRLKNAVELFILRHANTVAKRLIIPVK